MTKCPIPIDSEKVEDGGEMKTSTSQYSDITLSGECTITDIYYLLYLLCTYMYIHVRTHQCIN